jgi:Carbohydrate family 9 binding domain-like
VDGVGNEFCGFPAVFFDVLDGGAPDAHTPVVNAFVQVAWSLLGLHFFIHVNEADVVPAASDMPPWNGDAIEVFASANAVLTGPFGSGADKALQVIVGAPNSSGAAPSETATSVSGPLPSLPSSDYAARLVAGGYDVEIQLPWATIAGAAVTSPDAGTSLGLDLACDVHGVDGGAHRQAFLILHLPTQPPASCDNLYCDDRTWCLWKLAP